MKSQWPEGGDSNEARVPKICKFNTSSHTTKVLINVTSTSADIAYLISVNKHAGVSSAVCHLPGHHWVRHTRQSVDREHCNVARKWDQQEELFSELQTAY